jgi:hypothetical protein
MNKTTSQKIGPELIRIISFIKTAQSAVLKNRAIRGFFVAASAAKLSKRDISSASERAFPGFWGNTLLKFFGGNRDGI